MNACTLGQKRRSSLLVDACSVGSGTNLDTVSVLLEILWFTNRMTYAGTFCGIAHASLSV